VCPGLGVSQVTSPKTTEGQDALNTFTQPTQRTAPGGTDFAPLLEQVRAGGLLQTRRWRYASLIGIDLLALAAIWAAVATMANTWWVLFLAVPLAVFTTRVIFIGHDAGHRQVARTARGNHVLALLVGDLITGFGSRWWVAKHTRHHANPNHVGKDPDVAPGPPFAWTPEQAAERRGVVGGAWMNRHQAQLYFPLLLGEAINLKVASFRGAARSPRDLFLLCTHLTVYLGGPVALMGPGRAALFVVIHQGLIGLHLGVAFAPNHKGMPMPVPGSRPDFLRKQVLTSRNVTGTRAVDWFLGGLNYQIEHHLFPAMPRPNLRHAQDLVRAHCQSLGLSYTQETLRASLALTLRHLHAVGHGRAPAAL
jgi:fatty acid desaturase